MEPLNPYSVRSLLQHRRAAHDVVGTVTARAQSEPALEGDHHTTPQAPPKARTPAPAAPAPPALSAVVGFEEPQSVATTAIAATSSTVEQLLQEAIAQVRLRSRATTAAGGDFLSEGERKLMDYIFALVDPTAHTADSGTATTTTSSSAQPIDSQHEKQSTSTAPGPLLSSSSSSMPLESSTSASSGAMSMRYLRRVGTDGGSGTTTKGGAALERKDMKGYTSDLALRAFRVTEEGTPHVAPVDALGTVLFIDISGYSALTSAIESKGPYTLSKVVNKIFEVIVETCVDLFLGDVIKFAGDAVVVVWCEAENLSIQECCMRAAKCALYLQEMHPKFTFEDAPGVTLEMHMGISAGPLHSQVLQVPNLQHTQSNWHLLSGSPLKNIGHAVDAAARGEVAVTRSSMPHWPQGVSANCFGLSEIPSTPEALKIDPNCAESLSPVSPAKKLTGAEATNFEDQLEAERGVLPDDYDLLGEVNNMEHFVHPSIVLRIAAQMPPDHMSEMRLLGVMFVHLTQPLHDVGTWFAEVLGILDRHRCGTVQIIDDDKGLHVIAAANLHVAVAEPSKAIADATAELLARELGVTVGAAVGVTFCGVVGCEAARRWDITGAACVRACRLMQHGIANSIPGVFDVSVHENLTDLTVIRPLPGGPVTLKGSPTPVAVYGLDGSRNKALSVMTAARSFTETSVHVAARNQLTELACEGTHQRTGAIIAGPPGVGKGFLCQLALQCAREHDQRNAKGASPDRWVELNVVCEHRGEMQVLHAISDWFQQHPDELINVPAAKLHDALSKGHTHRAATYCVATIEAAMFANLSVAIIVGQAQHVDPFSLVVLQQLLSAEPSPGSGRFAALLTLVPMPTGMTAAAVAAKLSGRGFAPLRVRIGVLTDDEADALLATRLSWTPSDRLRQTVRALSNNIAVCIDQTVAMIQRQRPYITHLCRNGVVDAQGDAAERLLSKRWQEISPSLCARLQQYYDALEPRLQRVLRAIAALENNAMAVPICILAAAVSEFDRRGVQQLCRDLSLLEDLEVLCVRGPGMSNDVFSGAEPALQRSALNPQPAWPPGIQFDAESQKHEGRMRSACVSFLNPAQRDLVLSLIIPPQRRGFLSAALRAVDAPGSVLAQSQPVANLTKAFWHHAAAQMVASKASRAATASAAIARLLGPLLGAAPVAAPVAANAGDELAWKQASHAARQIMNQYDPASCEATAVIRTPPLPPTAAAPSPVPALSLMPMVVVFVKNFQPTPRLGPAVGPMLDFCKLVKTIATECSGGGNPNPIVLKRAITVLQSIDSVLHQVAGIVSRRGLPTSRQYISYAPDTPTDESIRPPPSMNTAVSSSNVNASRRRSSVDVSGPSWLWRSQRVQAIASQLASLRFIAPPTAADSASDSMETRSIALVEAVWAWLQQDVVSLYDSVGTWMEKRSGRPPEPANPLVRDPLQRSFLTLALKHIDEEGAGDEAVQRSILTLATCGWDSGHPRVNAAMLRDVLVYKRTGTPTCLKSFLYLTLMLSDEQHNAMV